MIIPCGYISMRARGFQRTAGLISTCTTKELRGDMLSACRIHELTGFLYHNYCYKSVATDIPHDFMFVPIPYLSENSFCPEIEADPYPLPQI